MIPIVLRSLSLLEKKPHACDVYGGRDFKCPIKRCIVQLGQLEVLSVETASQDDKCQLLTVDISAGSIRSYNKCLLLPQNICVGIQVYVAE
jgi:hypothetical protein